MFDFESYINTKEWAPFSTSQGKIYYQERNRLAAKFFEDCAELYGYTANPKRNALEALAWEKGHSGGYKGVHNWFLQLLPLIK